MNDSREALHQLGVTHHLSPARHQALLALTHPHLDADARLPGLVRAVMLGAALLLGLSLIMAVASQWGVWGRGTRFALLQAAVALPVLALLAVPKARPAAGLLALLAQGGLLAYFGQTYQTGADPWQLFALWALLGLPLAAAIRHDALWGLWSLVLSVALVLAVQTFGGRAWRPQAGHQAPVLLGALALLALALVPRLWQPAWLRLGLWAGRAQGLWSFVVLAGWSVLAAWQPQTVALYLALGALLALALGLLWRSGDAVLLSLAAMALDAWALGKWSHWVFSGDSDIGQLFVFASGAALLLAGTVSLLMRRLRASSSGARA